MKVYELIVHLDEGGPTDLGLFSSQERAEAAWAEQAEEWSGPNVLDHTIIEREVQ